jgi:ABC-2 type transport system permease protein
MATTSIESPLATPPGRVARSRASLAWTAFWAIFRRDVWVTGRDFIPFLIQVLIQPLFFLFIFGKVLPSIGATQPGYAALLLPGIVGLTTVTAALQGVTLPLVLDLGFEREIDDRLQSPLPVSFVAVEKVIFAALRGIIAGGMIFPLAVWVLGSDFHIRTDGIPQLILIMILTSLAGSALGLTIGTLVRPEQIGLMFSLILTPLLFTGCTYYPWSLLSGIKWFQVVTLFNPITYSSEGLRRVMVPPLAVTRIVNGHPVSLTVTLQTLDPQWVYLGLIATIVVFFAIGLRTFRSRVVS